MYHSLDLTTPKNRNNDIFAKKPKVMLSFGFEFVIFYHSFPFCGFPSSIIIQLI